MTYIRVPMLGKIFDRLTVIKESDKKGKIGQKYWDCICSCGNKKTVLGSLLRNKTTRSCGCLHIEHAKYHVRNVLQKLPIRYTHGKSKTKIYGIWIKMIERCDNVKDKGYRNYGGRGIRVSEDWHKFENFYRDMGDRPEGKSLDRIDNNGNYCKENCKWSTQKEQCNNTRRTVRITYRGLTKSIRDWSEILNIPISTITARIRKGYSHLEAIEGKSNPHK